jgi:hypothetical protein
VGEDVTAAAIVTTRGGGESVVTAAAGNDESRLRKVLVRTGMGCCMVAFYCSMLRGGYIYCILVGVLTQVRVLHVLHVLRCPTSLLLFILLHCSHAAHFLFYIL